MDRCTQGPNLQDGAIEQTNFCRRWLSNCGNHLSEHKRICFSSYKHKKIPNKPLTKLQSHDHEENEKNAKIQGKFSGLIFYTK